MVTEKAKHKARVLAFWGKHGLQATEEAFKVKRRTLYLWKSQYKKGGGKLEALNEKSRTPRKRRKREWGEEILFEIKKMRVEHPNIGKEKISVLLGKWCEASGMKAPSVSTIGNLIRDLGGLRVFPEKVRHNGKIVARKRQKKARKPREFKALYPGHLGSFDTVERFIHGCRRYVITFTDVYSRFSFAWATTRHGSQAAKEFFDLIRKVFPFELENILTDNGSEFMKYFDGELRRLHKEHWHTYPRTPKMNAHDERFNRSIQEEYIDYHEYELLDVEKFNDGLMDHLVWHNTQRPHFGLGLLSPLQFILQQPFIHKKCKMYLTNTYY
jgi:transposase InsO family protein